MRSVALSTGARRATDARLRPCRRCNVDALVVAGTMAVREVLEKARDLAEPSVAVELRQAEARAPVVDLPSRIAR